MIRTMRTLLFKTKRVMRDQKGFTLTELLVSSVIMVTVLTILAAILTEGIRSYSYTSAASAVQLDARLQVNILREQIRQSKFGTVNGTSYPYFDSQNNRLILFTGTELQPQTVTYDLVNGQLVYHNGQTQNVLLSDVSTFSVTVDAASGSTNIEIVLSTHSQPFQQNIQKTISLSAVPRGIITAT